MERQYLVMFGGEVGLLTVQLAPGSSLDITGLWELRRCHIVPWKLPGCPIGPCNLSGIQCRYTFCLCTSTQTVMTLSCFLTKI